MNVNRSVVYPTANPAYVSNPQRPWTSRVKPPVRRAPIKTRNFQIEWLAPNQQAKSQNLVGPALPMFEDAFSSFARGSLIQTPEGHVAVEDLQPGMLIDIVDGQPRQLVWKGSTSVQPITNRDTQNSSMLYRIADAGFGVSNTMPDLLLGSGARIMRSTKTDNPMERLCDIQDLCDGMQ